MLAVSTTLVWGLELHANEPAGFIVVELVRDQVFAAREDPLTLPSPPRTGARDSITGRYSPFGRADVERSANAKRYQVHWHK